MDDIFKLSRILKDPDVKETKEKEVLSELKLTLIEVQEEIDKKDNIFQFNFGKKISNHKKLLKQVTDEIVFNNNIYREEHEDYMYPKSLKELNILLRDITKNYDEKKEELDNYKNELQENINSKKEIVEKINQNNKILNCKEKRINNSFEISAIAQKKNTLMGNKKKNTTNLNKKLLEIEKQNKNDILYEEKKLELKNKKIQNKINDTLKILTKTISYKKDINVNSREFKVNTKEIQLLNESLDVLNNNLFENKKNFEKFCEENKKNYEKFEKKEKKKLKKENEKIDEIIDLLDSKFKEINNYFIDKKNENDKLDKKVKLIDSSIINLEYEILKNNINDIKNSKKGIEEKIIIEQEKSRQRFFTFKNKHEDKIAQLSLKKDRIMDKIDNLNKQKDLKDYNKELITKKNFIHKLLNEYS